MAECGSASDRKVKSKRYILILCLLAWVLVPIMAQPRLKAPEYYLGVHGGATAGSVLFQPTVSGMSPITDALVLGGNGGLVFRYAAHKYCQFQMELNYTHRGWKQSGVAHNLHYVDLPILMHLNFGSEVCHWIFNLGPQIGYCVWDENKSIDHPFLWGLVAGTGMDVKTRKAGVFELEVRFDFSFGGVFGTKVTDTYRMASPMDLSVNLGWCFPVRKMSAKDKALQKTLQEK